MKPALILAAANWLTVPAAALVVTVGTFSWPYDRYRLMALCRGSPLLIAITEAIVRFGVRACTWSPCSWSFRKDIDWRNNPQDLRTVKHEWNHAAWTLSLGLLYFLLYGVMALVAVIQGGHWHHDNWCERQAVAAETT